MQDVKGGWITEDRKSGLPLNTFVLKIIACVTMLIDHIGFMFFPTYTSFRIIGRIAMPVYCFLMAEGAYYTKNKKKYLGRMLLFAALSEIPFNVAVSGKIFYAGYQSVMITLLLGLICIFFAQAMKERIGNRWYLLPSLVVFVLAGWAAEFLSTDYGYLGIMMILAFYFFRDKPILKALSLILISSVVYMLRAHITTVPVQIFAILALIPIFLYNGKKGVSGKFVQYAFYAFYPVHLLILDLIRYFR